MKIKYSFFYLVLFLFLSACVQDVGRYNQSVKNTTKVDKALLRANLAKGYLKKKQYVVAQEEIKKALRINPSHSEANYTLALIEIELKNYPAAQNAFELSVQSDPKNAAAAHDFGVFLCQINKKRKSEKYFLLAAKNPLFSRADLSYLRVGECLSAIDVVKAKKYLAKAMELNPRMIIALFHLSSIQFQEKKYLSARGYIERFFYESKPSAAALFLAYHIEKKLMSPVYVHKYKQQLLTLFPDSKQADAVRKYTK